MLDLGRDLLAPLRVVNGGPTSSFLSTTTGSQATSVPSTTSEDGRSSIAPSEDYFARISYGANGDLKYEKSGSSMTSATEGFALSDGHGGRQNEIVEYRNLASESRMLQPKSSLQNLQNASLVRGRLRGMSTSSGQYSSTSYSQSRPSSRSGSPPPPPSNGPAFDSLGFQTQTQTTPRAMGGGTLPTPPHSAPRLALRHHQRGQSQSSSRGGSVSEWTDDRGEEEGDYLGDVSGSLDGRFLAQSHLTTPPFRSERTAGGDSTDRRPGSFEVVSRPKYGDGPNQGISSQRDSVDSYKRVELSDGPPGNETWRPQANDSVSTESGASLARTQSDYFSPTVSSPFARRRTQKASGPRNPQSAAPLSNPVNNDSAPPPGLRQLELPNPTMIASEPVARSVSSTRRDRGLFVPPAIATHVRSDLVPDAAPSQTPTPRAEQEVLSERQTGSPPQSLNRRSRVLPQPGGPTSQSRLDKPLPQPNPESNSNMVSDPSRALEKLLIPMQAKLNAVLDEQIFRESKRDGQSDVTGTGSDELKETIDELHGKMDDALGMLDNLVAASAADPSSSISGAPGGVDVEARIDELKAILLRSSTDDNRSTNQSIASASPSSAAAGAPSFEVVDKLDMILQRLTETSGSSASRPSQDAGVIFDPDVWMDQGEGAATPINTRDMPNMLSSQDAILNTIIQKIDQLQTSQRHSRISIPSSTHQGSGFRDEQTYDVTDLHRKLDQLLDLCHQQNMTFNNTNKDVPSFVPQDPETFVAPSPINLNTPRPAWINDSLTTADLVSRFHHEPSTFSEDTRIGDDGAANIPGGTMDEHAVSGRSNKEVPLRLKLKFLLVASPDSALFKHAAIGGKLSNFSALSCLVS